MIQSNKPPEFYWDIQGEYIFFLKGHLSQWWHSSFRFAGKDFNCAEQFMMYQKSVLMQDEETGKKILETDDPKEQQRLGRLIKNFDSNLWDKVKYQIVYLGNFLKFYQNKDLREVLFQTDNKQLVEVNPKDIVWGIALSMENPDRLDPKKWKGENLLGSILTNVRRELQIGN
ncbi:MAG TPA: NADAR family protein [Leptospiraceae bacterium]|nr:NADAR family protein [Leptospiraceae bacterium]HMX34500.1 NADAR family protein [Leptospiraceae bacterium]HMY31127.1 NADAR family protein [Leptospiraceae bacterium]HMZ63710.1 NADAR family protein [Leptospiraceae bacterium]HNA09053.1 NADAR family protein [Leptospiraceae bacterium]